MSHWETTGASDEWKRIRSLLDYSPDTGEFRWRIRIANVQAGTLTGSKMKKGYLLIRADKKAYLAHRLAWFWMTGEWPLNQVDHRNLIKDDNRWDNLRQATNAENHLNRGKNSNNTSGFKGVSFDKRVGQYAAYITVRGHRRFLGYHASAEQAHRAYAAEVAISNPEFGRA